MMPITTQNGSQKKPVKNIDWQMKQSGNIWLQQVKKPHIGGAMTKNQIALIASAVAPTLIHENQQRLGALRPMHLDFMTHPAMWPNGSMTAGTTIIKALRNMRMYGKAAIVLIVSLEAAHTAHLHNQYVMQNGINSNLIKPTTI